MKHVDLFNDFLKDTVNLNSTRVEQLETSTSAIENFIKDSDWEPEIDSWMAQGSWAHKTIIKPTDKGEFDADLIVFVHPVEGWDADKYIDRLYSVFSANGVYTDKVRRWSHCVTITYENDKKIDIAPCIVNRGGYQRLEVCNRTTKAFERSEPRQFTEWLVRQNSYSGSNSFRKVTRLLKYLRDIKTTFTCPSVLLTTLLGYRIYTSDQGTGAFVDTPSALKTIVARLDDYLQLNAQKPSVTNPYLSSENFADAWSDTQYSNFRTVIHRYRGWIDDAYNESARYESIAKWRRVFGDQFAEEVVIEEARSISKAAWEAFNGGVSTAALMARDAAVDLVTLVKNIGSRALPSGFNILPHMRRPRWKHASQQLTVQIKAALYRSQECRVLGYFLPARDVRS